ncbi:hypothetical protein MLD38_030694 [Melastoma candidum]|uniref:Uncharacterized protein n=1 Tax=Melastoma candidum TaxID=119954 RepID=A0ACB9MMH4_9MYRT|nr:hypothetical protein MLD38_030694 [Melastoma candidum]
MTQRDDDPDYESDPEETRGSLIMRRRAASDDEEVRVAADGGRTEEGEGDQVKRVVRVQSDESEGEGAAPEYDDDDEDEYYSEERYGEGEVGYREDGVEVVDCGVVLPLVVQNDRVIDGGGLENVEGSAREEAGDPSAAKDVAGEWGQDRGEEEEEEKPQGKKENEPFAVPTAGPFYMHDDRFRDNVGWRNRRIFGGRKLWESKDNRKWGHDKYEEMTIQERRNDQRRKGKGNYRGRGRNRAVDWGYPRAYGEKSYDNNHNVAITNTRNPNQVARSVRGRGPRRYESSFRKGSQAPSNQIKQKTAEESLQENVEQSVVSSTNRESNAALAKMQTLASNLNSSSPPFYPSSSSSKDGYSAQRKDAQLGTASQINRSTVVDDNFSVPELNSPSRGKNVSTSIGVEKLSIDDSFAVIAGKPLSPMPVAPVNGSQSLHNQNRFQTQGRAGVFPVDTMSYQLNSQGPVGRASPAMQENFDQKCSMSNRIHAAAQQSGQHAGGGQNSSPSKVPASANSYEVVDAESPTDSSELPGSLVPKGKSPIQGSGRGSVIFSGPPVVGSGGNAGGDQNFPGTPAFLPVMQFGHQRPGGLGLPAVGMAFPGYVAQPQLDMGNSEMTWLPVLTGAAGALGAAYCSPYITIDGSYHSPAGQTTTASSSSKESHSNKPNNEWKPAQRPELLNEDNGQRQNKPRRYSEMNFGHGICLLTLRSTAESSKWCDRWPFLVLSSGLIVPWFLFANSSWNGGGGDIKTPKEDMWGAFEVGNGFIFLAFVDTNRRKIF